MKRTSKIERKTRETSISVSLNIDGTGKYKIDTGIPFFNHMLELFAKHGLFDIDLKAKGDVEVDYHHTVEDVGICLGEAFKQALGKKERIERYGSIIAPMDEALSTVVIDISGRPHLSYNVKLPKKKFEDFDTEVVKEFFKAFVQNAGITLHITLLSGENTHHMIESMFKGFAVALSKATAIHPRKRGVSSTKGQL
jgi:imidazoleglycerol-phosphate dehydratase